MTTVSSAQLVCTFDEKNKEELRGACTLADEYWQQGIPVSVFKSGASKRFGEFMSELTVKEQQQIYAMTYAIMTAQKLA